MTNRPSSPGAVIRVAALVAAILLAAPVAAPRSAEAHAAYRDSSPAFAEELAASPQRITLAFSQSLFRREGENTITLRDAGETAWGLSPPVVDPGDRQSLHADIVTTLPPGRYLVSWINLSADDGDSAEGTYSFYVGRPPTEAERDADRTLAAELLIPYPGDEQSSPAVEEGGAPDPPAPRTLPATADADEGGIGAAPLALAMLSGLAVVGVLSSCWRRGRRQ